MIANIISVGLHMIENDGRTAAELCTAVTSKNGTTEAARKHVDATAGIVAACKRSQEIGEQNAKAIEQILMV